MRLYRWWKARRITKMFMAQFAQERIEQLVAEAEEGPLYTAEDIGRILGVGNK
jgi:hypothetical protein